jgi:hypothetical protein
MMGLFWKKKRRMREGSRVQVANLSCPIVFPEPSDLDQPELSDCSSLSQVSSSSAVILTSSLSSQELRGMRVSGCSCWNR